MLREILSLSRLCILIFIGMESIAMIHRGIRGDYAAVATVVSAWGKEGIRKRKEKRYDPHFDDYIHINIKRFRS